MTSIDERAERYIEAAVEALDLNVLRAHDRIVAHDVAAEFMAVANAEQAELGAAAKALAAFARYHAMHAEVSKGDRARIAELCDQIQGYDAHLDSQRIVAACADDDGR